MTETARRISLVSRVLVAPLVFVCVTVSSMEEAIGGSVAGSIASLTDPPIVHDVFTPTAASSDAEIEARRLELANEYEALHGLEELYLASYRANARSGRTAETIRASLQAFASALDGPARAALESGERPHSDEAARRRSELFFQEFDAWVASQRAHQSLIDRLNVEKTAFFVKQARFYADVSYRSLMSSAGEAAETKRASREIEKIGALHDRLVAAHEKFRPTVGLYGTPKDTFRLVATREVFAATKDYFRAVQRFRATRGERLRAFAKTLAAIPRRLWENLKLLSLVPDAVRLASDIAFRGGGPLHATVDGAFVKAARARGYRVRIEGLEHLRLPAGSDASKTITVVAKVHRGPVLDSMVLAGLGLVDYAYVTSFGSMMPPFLSERLIDNPGIAFVGPGFPNGIETVSNKAIHNPARTMVNYAEGSIGNFGETRPVASKFFTDLLPAIRAKGYRINLVPVTSQAASFMKRDLDEKLLFGRIIDARVHPALTNEVLNLVQSSGRSADLSVLLRATWLDELATDVDAGGNLIEGALSIRGMEEMAIKYMSLFESEVDVCPLFMRKI